MLIGQTIGTGAYRFEIEQELGSGAMGTVYRAKFHKNDKLVPVALKVVALGLLGNEGAMARFTREANILKQLSHPHIVRLYATGTYRKTPFIAMEFVDGEALDRVLARRGRLSWEEVVGYAKQLCEALQYAHDKGIIHRDLKPSNLMITREGTLKLTDFGIAKDQDVTALTGANSTIGTAAYMSPEQCKGDKHLTAKSDLYSLGIVLFELLTGKKPFYADTTVDMFLKHVNEKPPRVGKLMPDVPAKLESLILQLLEKDKEDRPTDAAWLVRMLGEVEDDAYARKSAGVDAAKARKIDRRHDPDAPTVEAADREAARALRGEKKKKKRKKGAPWYEHKGVRAAGIIALLLGMAVGVYFAFIKDPSPDSLYAAIEAATTPEQKLEAATKYLEKHGDKPGPQTDAASAVWREGKTRERENQLVKRHGSRYRDKPDENEDPEAFRTAMLALDAEKAGQLRNAADLWGEVKKKFPEEAKVPFTSDDALRVKASWSWVADKRIRDIQSVGEERRKLVAKIDDNRRFEVATAFDPANPESVGVRALRLERLKDTDKAGREWDRLMTLTEREPEHHVLYLLAAAERATIPKAAADNGLDNRRLLIREQLTAIEADFARVKDKPDEKAERAGVRIRCRDIVELYEDESDKLIADAVKRAKEIIGQLPRT